MTDNTYNGWTNYATWRINLEIFDGLNPIEDWGLEIDERGADDEYAKEQLAEALENYAEEVIFEGSEKRNIADSYAEAFLSEVNWYEIARHKLEECAQ
jgi:hypothetical protein